jgi:hypothetical protein
MISRSRRLIYFIYLIFLIYFIFSYISYLFYLSYFSYIYYLVYIFYLWIFIYFIKCIFISIYFYINKAPFSLKKDSLRTLQNKTIKNSPKVSPYTLNLYTNCPSLRVFLLLPEYPTYRVTG